MKATKTATGSQKTGSDDRGASPFNQITELEKRENERVEKEISALEKEKQEVMTTCQNKEEEAEHNMRQKAKGELKEFSEKELSQIVDAAKKEAEAEAKKLEEEYKKFEASAAKDLAQKAKDPDFLLAA